MNTTFWSPAIIEEDTSGKHSIDLLSTHLTNRRVFITGEVNDDMCDQFCSEIIALAEKPEEIDIIINSPGGNVTSGMVIHDILTELNRRGIKTNGYVCGSAASMASIILCGCTNRYALPNSKIMIHQASINTLGGKVDSVKRIAESLTETMNQLTNILAERTGKPTEEIESACLYDHYYSAKEAKEFGLIDDIKFPF